jgi:DNA-binding response OmpR family regulator
MGLQGTPPEGVNLQGRRILVVEDEVLIGMMLQDMLSDFGCEVIGPIIRLAPALEVAKQEQVDLAILDVNLAGEAVFPVADALQSRKVPIIFSTGYGTADLVGPYKEFPTLSKPYDVDELRRVLTSVV